MPLSQLQVAQLVAANVLSQGGGSPSNIIRLNGAAIKFNGKYIIFTKAA